MTQKGNSRHKPLHGPNRHTMRGGGGKEGRCGELQVSTKNGCYRI